MGLPLLKGVEPSKPTTDIILPVANARVNQIWMSWEPDKLGKVIRAFSMKLFSSKPSGK